MVAEQRKLSGEELHILALLDPTTHLGRSRSKVNSPTGLHNLALRATEHLPLRTTEQLALRA
ncbi:MAG: hypothetical protein ACOVLE_06315, partial [Pirellula staleyi]